MAMTIERRAFLLTLGAACALGRQGEPGPKWTEKHPPEWTPGEIRKILDDSAWVQQAPLQAAPDERSADGRAKQFVGDLKVVVRWESAAPIRLARRGAGVPEATTLRYIVSVSRLPLSLVTALSGGGPGQPSVSRTEMASKMAAQSFLERAGKEPIAAHEAVWTTTDFDSRIDISFTDIHQPIELADHSVRFKSKVGSFILAAEFQLRRMVYHGTLAV